MYYVFFYGSQNKQRLFLYTVLINKFCKKDDILLWRGTYCIFIACRIASSQAYGVSWKNLPRPKGSPLFIALKVISLIF